MEMAPDSVQRFYQDRQVSVKRLQRHSWLRYVPSQESPCHLLLVDGLLHKISVLCLQELGFSFVELNASDTRSKKSLKGEVAEALGNHTLMDFMGE